jgi:hypothetical protein
MDPITLIIIIAVAIYLGVHFMIQRLADMGNNAVTLLADKQQLASNKFYLSNKVNRKDAVQAELNRRSFTNYSSMDDEELEAELARLSATK